MKFNKTNKSLDVAEKALEDRIIANFEEITNILIKINNIKISDINNKALSKKIIKQFEEIYNDEVIGQENEDVISIKLDTLPIIKYAEQLVQKEIESYMIINNLTFNSGKFQLLINLKLIDVMNDINADFAKNQMDELQNNIEALINKSKFISSLSKNDKYEIQLAKSKIKNLTEDYITEVLNELFRSNNVLAKIINNNYEKSITIVQV